MSISLVFLAHANLGDILPGGFGVTIFFFISGFLITTLLSREYDKYGSVSFRAFYIRRAYRIVPPLVLTLALAVALTALGAISAQIEPSVLISQVFFYFNYWKVYSATHYIPGTGVIWSLAVEEHFYLLFPFLFVPLIRMRRVIALSIAILIGFLLWRLLRYLVLGTPEDTIYYLTDTRLDSLYYGCFLAILMRIGVLPWDRDPAPGAWARSLAIGAGLCLIVVSLVIREETFRATLRYSLQGLGLMPIVYYAVTQPDLPIFRPLNWPLVRYFGVLSYSFYLIHHILIQMFEARFDSPNESLYAGVLTFVLGTAYAALMHRYVEKPFARMRKRMTGHKATPAAIKTAAPGTP